ncbi:MAG: hypothetical protein AAF664_06970 [Planctomycetota bacterium]
MRRGKIEAIVVKHPPENSESRAPADRAAMESIEERLLEVLLAEVVENQGPGDISKKVLSAVKAEKARSEASEEPLRVSVNTDRRTRPARSRRRRMTRAAIVAASIAAAFLLAVGFQWILRRDAGNARIAAKPLEVRQTPSTGLSSGDSPDGATTVARSETIPSGSPDTGTIATIPSARTAVPARPSQSPAPQPSRPGRVPAEPLATKSPAWSWPGAEKVALGSWKSSIKDVETAFASYWSDLGLEPSGKVSSDELASRIRDRFGVPITIDELSSPVSTYEWLGRPKVARAVAKIWLATMVDRNASWIQKQAGVPELTNELAQLLSGPSSTDQFLLDLVSDSTSPHASTFKSLLANHKSRSRSGAQQDWRLVDRLGELTMGVDLRCVRCHDSYIAGKGTQSDYWQFAGVLADLANDSGQNEASSLASGTVVFERPDMTMAATSAGVPKNWFDRSDREQWDQSQTPERLDDWRRSLSGSRTLARAMALTLFETVSGRSLQSTVVDPMGVPGGESLTSIQRQFESAMLNSDFDVRRVLTMTIHSPALARSVTSNIGVSGDRDHAQSEIAALAAMPPMRGRVSTNDRLAIHRRAIGVSIGPLEQRLLGQFAGVDLSGISESSDSKNADLEMASRLMELARWDFPDHGDGSPAGWLESIDDEDQRLAHLAYLNNRSELPETIAEAAQQMSKAGLPEPIRLSRLWWIIIGSK